MFIVKPRVKVAEEDLRQNQKLYAKAGRDTFTRCKCKNTFPFLN